MKFSVKNKYLLVAAAVVAAALIWLGVDRSQRTATIVIEYTPMSSTVEVDNRKVAGKKGVASRKVKPGKYRVSVSKSGFKNHTEEVEVNKDDKVTIYAALESNSPDTIEWYVNNPEDEGRRQQILDSRLAEGGAIIEKNFPIMSILPYTPPRGAYRIDYGIGKDPNSQAVYISYYTDKAKELALEYIEDHGFEIDDYEVIYNKINYEAEPIHPNPNQPGEPLH